MPARVALSVVIASHNAERVIAACLLALERQRAYADLEVIVADSSTDGTRSIVETRFSWVHLLNAGQPLAVPALRGRGIAAARGDVIAIIDPFSIVTGDWAAAVLRTHRRQRHPVVGGAVDLHRADDASYAEWALYLNEYGLFMSPVIEGETWILPGSNLSYKRAALFDADDRPRYPVFWKTYVNWELEGVSSALWLDPLITVELCKPIAFSDYLSTRYLHGRCFGGMRVAGAPMATRLLRAASTVAVPVVLLWRWTAGFWPKRRRRLRFAASVPAQIALFSVWAWGEACGYLRGPRSCCDHLYY
jgi:glycosyltransferase involved in cell wall biosynthesis